MSAPAKLTKAQLVKLIGDLERSPEDKGRILGDVGITVAIEENKVLRLLSATTQGSLVVVRGCV